jgi:PIN domain nuclease of toxin-antitoxin system
VRLLLDTHVWLWLVADEDRFTAEARGILGDPESQLYLSVVAVWEIAIKHAAGKLRYAGQPAVQVPLHITRSGVLPLGISVDHALAAAALPMHHRDPFDRMMIAQAQAEELTVATVDARFGAYDVPLLKVAA